MQTITIKNKQDNESYTKDFNSIDDAKTWVINHLDLSKNWEVKTKNEKENKMTNINEKTNNLVKWLNDKYGDEKKSFTLKIGKKYFKICDQENGQIRSVYCFVDPQGNILKPNSWNSPHKTPRGTVLSDENWNKICYQFGVKYINGFANY